MRNKYSNSVKTEKRLKMALADIIEERHSVDEITISEIVKRAKVNRGTFYTHYSSIGELIDTFRIDIVNYMTKITTSPTFDILNPDTYLSDFIGFFKGEGEMYKVILPYSSRKSIDKAKKDIFTALYTNSSLKKNTNCSDEEFIFRLSFTVSGLVDIAINFICGTLNVSFENLPELLKQTIQRELLK